MKTSHLLIVFASACTLAVAAACSSGEPSHPGPDGSSPGADGAPPSSSTTTGTTPGSGSASDESTPGGPAGLPCEVKQLLSDKCSTCHSSSPSFGASTALVTHDDLLAEFPKGSGKKVLDLVRDRVHNDTRPMPPSPNPRLTSAESGALDGWIAAGAPKSAAACAGAPSDGKPATRPLSCTPDLHIASKTPFKMAQNAALDQYVCFGFDVPVTQKRHVIALAPKVDNKKIIHHILLFQTEKAESPTPTPCAAFGSAAWHLVTGWAPGGQNLELPPEAGFPEEVGTTHWVMQLHYNNALNLAGAEDSSGYDLCTTDKLRANDASIVAFGSTNFNIPPRATATTTCNYQLPQSFKGAHLFNTSPHMHKQGKAMSTFRIPGGSGTPEKVIDQAAFSFEAQGGVNIATTVAPGDVMRTKCTWQNPTDKAISFGEGTDAEMCFNFVGYYPKIPDTTIFGLPIFTWVTPSASATCAMTTE